MRGGVMGQFLPTHLLLFDPSFVPIRQHKLKLMGLRLMGES